LTRVGSVHDEMPTSTEGMMRSLRKLRTKDYIQPAAWITLD
jgi:hypothetical protein